MLILTSESINAQGNAQGNALGLAQDRLPNRVEGNRSCVSKFDFGGKGLASGVPEMGEGQEN